jgi:hypothetical protein
MTLAAYEPKALQVSVASAWRFARVLAQLHDARELIERVGSTAPVKG